MNEIMKDSDWAQFSPFFKREEFDSPDVPGSGNNMRFYFLSSLYEMRKTLGIPLVISKGGGFRTAEYHKLQESTHGDISDHTEGCGVDVKCLNPLTRKKIIKEAIRIGLDYRMGIYDKHIHLGTCKKIPEAWWIGKSK